MGAIVRDLTVMISSDSCAREIAELVAELQRLRAQRGGGAGGEEGASSSGGHAGSSRKKRTRE
jgi:hypothetical protein